MVIAMESSYSAIEPEALYLETLHGLFGSVAEHVAPSTLNAAIAAFRHMLSVHAPPSSNDTRAEQDFTRYAMQAGNYMCQEEPAVTKKKSWTKLQEKAQSLQEDDSDFQASALALSFLFGSLALLGGDAAKAAASAISSTISHNKPLRHAGRGISNHVLRAYLVHACYSDSLNFNILTHFAKAFKLTDEEEPAIYPELSANVIRFGLGLSEAGEGAPLDSAAAAATATEEEFLLQKQKVSGALAFACQIRPWPILSPRDLVEIAIPYSYWHVAEQICLSAYDKAVKPSPGTNNGEGEVSTTNEALAEAILATETLIDTVMEDRTFRLADNIATKLYKEGGKSRYIEARYYHAHDTINKLICKRQLPIIERQVERVDKAVAKVEGDTDKEDTCEHEGSTEATTESPPSVWASPEIRKFTLERLQEEGEFEAAHRLSEIWGIDYVYDEEAMLEAAAARRKRYIQWDEVITGNIPDLISDPHELRQAFERLHQPPYQKGPFGFDAEWDEDTKGGASVLQLASPKIAILIDVPSLSATAAGCSALAETVGALFDSEDSIVVGFCPRQDVSRMRGSSHQSEHHWLGGIRATADAQKLAGQDEPRLAKLGLSQVCEHYLGKPLDKAEQCSSWSSRPLSVKQRAYAALDAWVCAAVYEKLYPACVQVSSKET
jgi:hypothetical protein